MIEPDFPASLAAEEAVDAGLGPQEVADPREVGEVPDVDVRDLVVADGEGPAVERVEDLAERAGADR